MHIHSQIMLEKILSAKRKELCDIMYFLNLVRRHLFEIIVELRGGANTSLGRPTSRCRRTESIVSLERGVCSFAELQVFSCYRGWKEACQATRVFNNVEKRAVINNVFPARQGSEGNSRYSDRNIRGTCTIVCHHQKLSDPVLKWWFFHLWCASSWETRNSDHPGDYWSNSRTNLGRPPDFG